MSGLADTTLQLDSGARIPQVGLGVWQTPSGATTQKAVAAALAAGYRHIDTARIYGNEADVGAAVRASGVARAAVFVTTKLWNPNQGYDRALRAFDASLERLGLDYVDLYLIHWPVDGKAARFLAGPRAHPRGRARAFDRRQQFPGAAPRGAAGQGDAGPGRQPDRADAVPSAAGDARALRPARHRRRSVQSAHARQAPGSPGRRRHRAAGGNVRSRRCCSGGACSRGWVVLPKSTKPARIAENGALFDFALDDRAMRELDGLEEGLVTGWDPAEQP